MTLRKAIAAIEACQTEKEACELQTTFAQLARQAPPTRYTRQVWLECEERANEKAEKLHAEWWADWQADREQNEALGK